MRRAAIHAAAIGRPPTIAPISTPTNFVKIMLAENPVSKIANAINPFRLALVMEIGVM